MNDTKQTDKQSGLMAVAKRIDTAALAGQECFSKPASFESAIALAQGVQELRAALTDEVMDGHIMPLMNMDIGFKTDRDPRTWKYKDKDGNLTERDGSPFKGTYTREVVRDVMVAMMLRGFYPVNNEINIIANNGYAALNGLKRRLDKWPELTDLEINYGVPEMKTSGAIVPVAASWRIGGVSKSLKADIPVRVNNGMGVDAILGKASRKVYKRILDRVSGTVTPDGDVSDSVEPNGTTVTPGSKPAASFDRSKSVDADFVDKPKAAAAPEAPAAQHPKANPTAPQQTSNSATFAGATSGSQKSTSPATNSSAASATTQAAPVVENLTAQQEVAHIVTSAGHTFDDFVKWGRESGNIANDILDRLTCFDDLTSSFAARVIGSKKAMLKGLAAMKGGN
jgi:hypothetical protein